MKKISGIFIALVLSSCSYDNPVETAVPTQSERFNIQRVIQNNCTVCHSRTPSQKGYLTAPHGIVFDTDADIFSQKEMIIRAAVINKTMPPKDEHGHKEDDSHSHDENAAIPGLSKQDVEILTAWMNEG